MGSQPKFTKKPRVDLDGFLFVVLLFAWFGKGFSCFGFVWFLDKGLCKAQTGAELTMELRLPLN